MLALGVVIVGYSLLWMGRSAFRLVRYEKTHATITRLQKVNAKGGWSYAPVYEFSDRSGRVCEKKGSFTVGQEPAVQPGDVVSVAFDPERPEMSDIYSYAAFLMQPLLLMGFGITWLCGIWNQYVRESSRL